MNDDPKSVLCHFCGARPGEACRTRKGDNPLPGGITHVTRKRTSRGHEPSLNASIDFGPQYAQGHVFVENQRMIDQLDLTDCTLGVQVSFDGRVWLCVNGVAWIRFKPTSGKWRTSEVIE